MADVPKPLPDDPTLLKQVVEALLKELEEKVRLEGQLRQQITMLAQRLYGRSAEKVDPNQLQLAFEELLRIGAIEPKPEVEEETEPERASKPRRSGGTGRRPLPKELPRKRVVLGPAIDECSCTKCGSQNLKAIGEEISEQLDFTPGTFWVNQFVRPKYGCLDCEDAVMIAPPAPKPVAKGMAGPGLLAHVVTSKYADHLPLHRLEGIFARSGVDLSRSTLCDWVADVADIVAPVVDYCKTEILKSAIIHTDDTTVPVLDRQCEKTRTGRLWVYIGDKDHEHVVFDFTPDRKRAGPEKFLKGFSGYLQADAYTGYDALFAPGDVIEVACWAHARRKFYEARMTFKKYSFTALAFIKQLYEIERKAADFDSQQRKDFRQKYAVPVLAAFEKWLKEDGREVLPKSALGKAIGYAFGQWRALNRYAEDGRLAIDNNVAERALRAVAIGRKNWLFAGNDEGGRRAAILYSVIASCKLHQLDPYAYFRDLLQCLTADPQAAIDELTPLAFARRLRQPEKLATAA